MSLGQQVSSPQAVPLRLVDVQHLTQFLAREGQERFKSNSQVSHKLQRQVKHRLHTLGVSLDHLPRLRVSQILVADAGQVHSLLLRVAEAETFNQALHLSLHVLKFLNSLTVVVSQFARSRHHPVVVLLGKLQRTVHKVAVHSHQFVVVASLEVLPRKVVILRFGRIRCKHIAQHVLFAGQVLQVLIEPYRPVARGRNLVVLKIKELVGRHIVGQNV